MKYYFFLLRIALIVVCTLSCTHKAEYVYYSEYGAVGDGVANDIEAIVRTHEAANEAGLPVRADAGATYYIGGEDKTALIKTDTDWGNAKFIIDDRNVERRNSNIFNIVPSLPVDTIKTVKTLKKNQTKLDLSLPYNSFIVAIDNTTMRFIREGLNQNNGSPQIDVFVVDKNGDVDMKAPIIWDFDNINSMVAYPIDTKKLTVRGGFFTTIANQAESRYTYYSRGISVTRSNVVIDSVYHEVRGEIDHGAPYNAFIAPTNCTGLTVQNCLLSGHTFYTTIGAANAPVQMGTYDIYVNRSTNVSFINCKQINDIHSETTWGIFASNYSKNLLFDGVEFSRFDAHMGVANATIRNSVLGRQGINIIGCGLFLIENTKVYGSNFINLRNDYGSTWEGELVIRNCEYIPRNGKRSDATIINGSYSSQHDFGYPCFMPKKITIDGLVIHDTNPVENYQGPKLFAMFNRDYISAAFVEKYPYGITEEVVIQNMTIKSEKPYIVSNNPFMFRNVSVTEK